MGVDLSGFTSVFRSDDKLSSAMYALCTLVDLTLVIHMMRSPSAKFWVCWFEFFGQQNVSL